MWTWIKIGAGVAAFVVVLFSVGYFRQAVVDTVYSVSDTVKSKSPFFYNETLALKEVNAWRKEHGRDPLKVDRRLTRAAEHHADYMAEKDYIGHKSGFWPFQKSVIDRAREAGYNPRSLGENVAGGQKDFDEALDSWKKSPGHNRNLLAHNATDIGMAVTKNSKGKYQNYWVMVLGSE